MINEIWGYVFSSMGALLTATSFIPQALKTIRTRDTKSISILMYILMVFGSVCWLLFGITANNYFVILCNVLILILGLIILKIKVNNYQT